MKDNTIIICLLLFVGIVLSCTKDYKCQCIIDIGCVIETRKYSFYNTTKRDAKDHCDRYVPINSNANVTCNLK